MTEARTMNAPPKPRTLLDEMIRLIARLPPMSSSDIARIVCEHAELEKRPTAIDVRLLLKPPYFRLVGRGWICRWKLPMSLGDIE